MGGGGKSTGVAAAKASKAASTASAAGVKRRSYTRDESTSISTPFNLFGTGAPIPAPPAEEPKFDTASVRAAIPKHCFERSLVKSLSHLAWDIAIISLFAYGATFIPSVEPAWLRYVLWPLYWVAQGSVGTGLWVLAHECGHQAFSDSKFINDTVGWFAHSFLLVPYHAWRVSHHKHHANTCSMEHDEVFVPSTRSMFKEMVADTPLAHAWNIFVMLTFGWPGYLVANFSGPAKYSGKENSHFTTGSALFVDEPDEGETPAERKARESQRRSDIVVSDVGFFLMIALLAVAGQVFGSATVIAMYVIPYLIVNLHLVLITFLQHTDTYVPHYREGQFTWLKGALSTVDRSYGWLIDNVFHHITDTHVVHHLFSQMPFYNAVEATKAVREFLGPYYMRDDTPIPAALWRAWSKCRFVEDEGDYVFYKSAKELNLSTKKTA